VLHDLRSPGRPVGEYADAHSDDVTRVREPAANTKPPCHRPMGVREGRREIV
jgi:hypothetical protein